MQRRLSLRSGSVLFETGAIPEDMRGVFTIWQKKPVGVSKA